MMGCDGCELWNPKAGVKICYAGKIIDRYGGKSTGYPDSFDKPKLFLSRLGEAERWPDLRGTERPEKPWLNGQPRLIFLDDMGDTFTESLPIDWLAPLLPRMGALPHIFILLTKRANRMLEFSKTHPFPQNFWLLVSVTSAANYNRIEQLMQVCGGSVKGISYEPAWGPIDIGPWLPRRLALEEIPGSALNDGCTEGWTAGLGWAVVGGQSGDIQKPFDIAWARDLRDQCRETQARLFVKQMGSFVVSSDKHDWLGHRGTEALTGNGLEQRWRILLNDKKGGDISEFPEDLRIRQFPEIRA
jgi:protein gp37